MRIAIALGSYKLTDFVRLNLLQLRSLFGAETPILVSDDKSENTDEIRKLAEDFDCSWAESTHRRGHFGGDVQSTCNGISFAEQEGCEIVLKLSQRIVPVLPKFRELIERPFENPKINIIVPGKINSVQIRLASQKFFGSFGVLSDIFAIRVGSITAKQFLDGYVANMKLGRFHPAMLCECYLGQLLATHFNGASFVSDELANHKIDEPMCFLRKAQADPKAYQMIADFHGLKGGHYPCEDYGMMEGQNYLSRPCLQ